MNSLKEEILKPRWDPENRLSGPQMTLYCACRPGFGFWRCDPGRVVYAHNPSAVKWKQEDQKFKITAHYTASSQRVKRTNIVLGRTSLWRNTQLKTYMDWWLSKTLRVRDVFSCISLFHSAHIGKSHLYKTPLSPWGCSSWLSLNQALGNPTSFCLHRTSCSLHMASLLATWGTGYHVLPCPQLCLGAQQFFAACSWYSAWKALCDPYYLASVAPHQSLSFC